MEEPVLCFFIILIFFFLPDAMRLLRLGTFLNIYWQWVSYEGHMCFEWLLSMYLPPIRQVYSYSCEKPGFPSSAGQVSATW